MDLFPGEGRVIEIVMPIGIIAGVADRLAAFIMAGQARELLWDFLKNFSLASGFILLVVGLDGHSWHHFVDDRLSSSHPYAATALAR